ncbi:efflux transporter, RND family, MFP subunit [Thermaerobacter marianensis DSM 12885]|uniref:Efflux transporter, RND family, MFP subunit n=1 Tax=Thermaerobacter marianensis (strain ATCC 700841 / DSM 12885 / JCM 10246 / 7p75a) TaxID=644966 RepID=E6SJ54_THEM7|nr:efflux RND transporter periplasmic adaptor subunit [Thermaerobacter marianensis]ADU52078.1 efflux transporter, RND family, MFP subunit [Thermaerobacter marianensis DSM 12885]
MNRRLWRLLVVYLLLAAAAAGTVGVAIARSRHPDSRPIQAVHPQRRPMEDVIFANGRVAPRHQQKVLPRPGLAVESIPVEEGQTVKKGDVLVRYAAGELEGQVRQAELALQRAQLEHRRAQGQLERARACARENGTRGEAAQGPPDEPAPPDHCIGSVPEAEAELQVELARLGVEQARWQLEQARRQLAGAEVRSELDGVVLQVADPEGDLLQGAGGPLVTVGTLEELVVDLVVPELDGVRVRSGQKVRILSDAFPDATWEGTVERVGALVVTRTGMGGRQETGVPVTVALPQGTPLKPGYTVNLEIVVEARQALAVPLSALVGTDGAEVWVIHDGRAVRRPIEVGVSDAEWAEVRSGLTPEDWVVVDPPADLRPGDTVRLVARERQEAAGDEGEPGARD